MLAVALAVLAFAAPALAAPARHPHAAPALAGTLVVRQGDGVRGRRSFPAHFFVRRPGGRLEPVAGAQPERLVGQQVRVGDGGTARPATAQQVLAAPAPGTQTVLVEIVTTPDATTPAADQATARARIFTDPGSPAAFYAAQSGGAVTLTGDVTPPLAIPTDMAGCDIDAIAADADAAAANAGYTPAAYDHVVYLMPHSDDCGWAGLGDMPGRLVWSNGSVETNVIAHELGHNMGANHASLLHCVDGSGHPVAFSATCTSDEYGDPFDVMASAGAYGSGSSPLMGAWHRLEIGELPADEETTLHASGTVALTSSEVFGTSGTRLLLIPRKQPHQPVTSWFAVDARGPQSPFDWWSDHDPISTGLTIRVVGDPSQAIESELVDTTPATATPDDTPLQPGSTFTDAADHIAIEAGTDTAGDLTAKVTMPALADDVPPSAVASLDATGTTAGVHVTWGAATDDTAVARYEVLRDGVLAGTTTGTTFDDANVAALASATYSVVPVDTSANRGPASSVSLTLFDATPPTAPPALRASVDHATGLVHLTWRAAADNRSIQGYELFRDGALLGFVTGRSADDAPGDGRHAYVVKALDENGNEGPGASLSVDVARGAVLGTSKVHHAIRLASGVRRGRRLVLVFSAHGARAMRVSVRGHRVAHAHRGRVRATVRDRRDARVRVTVVATWAHARVMRTFVLS